MGGTLSSSDGQRIPVAGKSRKATALRRYFLSQRLISYSWTSDQFAQYGTKVVPATIREATYVAKRSSTMPRSWRLSSLRRILLAIPTWSVPCSIS